MLNPFQKKLFFGAVLFVPVFSFLGASASAHKGGFRVYNQSAASIVNLYISSSNQESWDNNLLEGQPLSPSEHINIVFGDSSADACDYDIRAEFSDGAVLEDFRVNVCEAPAYTYFEGQ